MVHKLFALLKIILFNFFFFFLIILVVEIIFGSWFKNNFNLRLSSERNIDRVYKFNFDYHKGQSRYLRDNFGFRVKSDKAIYHYKLAYKGEYLDIDEQFTLKWNDPSLKINWKIENPILSKRDS